MSTYSATISWSRQEGEKFTNNRYSRAHSWKFDGGETINASSSPQVVPLPYSDESAVDPEEAFIASLSSCHMLWFLSIVAKRGFVVEAYEDEVEGIMEKNAEGKLAMTEVTLHPKVTYAEEHQPTEQRNDEMHHEAHEVCFIANSVKTKISIKSVMK
ncbi:OsmC family protein [Gracilimonas mengyeensis]|uniref:Organic hydroperoxide reductase OsmC/OhrA n=1 Tax=Gracilimonas mengyeensis TaxID=1302730 RepID=A0A521DRJ5_9BACT|nr:OsmC family protein [Gracilimonas mengyeensis]SMO74326.1 Organic hydroperoxide reductase OsmC/OhrA [Gracilimonas mengyeensis]